MKMTPNTNVNAPHYSVIVEQYKTVSLQEINSVTNILPRQEFLLAHRLSERHRKTYFKFWISADMTKRHA